MAPCIAVMTGGNDIRRASPAAIHAGCKVLRRALEELCLFRCDCVLKRKERGALLPHGQIAVIAATALARESGHAITGYRIAQDASGIENIARPESGLAGTRQRLPNGQKRCP